MTTLHVFAATEGVDVYAGLVQAQDGHFYGIAEHGGMYGRGTAFRMDPLGTVTVLHSFGNPADPSEGSDPNGTLIEASDGYLYGTTVNGGVNFGGTLFRMDTDGNVEVVLAFVRLREGEISWPQAGVIQAADGSLWGTAFFGGFTTCDANGCGGIFRLDPDGTVTTHLLTPGEGYHSYGLVQASDGQIYGVTYFGGANRCGTAFVIDTAGELSVLTDFPQAEVCHPVAPLVQAADGFLYGIAQSNHIFQIDAFGAVAAVYMFGGPPDDGSLPVAGLIQANDGSLLGTTSQGGSENRGTVYRLTQP